ncbi:hypothetical protein A0H76_1690 [Hepatospora eriocheir]|uniref:Uncharacterized protein n=1 Tax=Hepatospora eriocheir TaxID=1081669 RepID=A0A1X0QKK7_9MICR|nr:hypothetical protein A0H76_1690 [Hepatospora eriocheir]
MKINNTVTEREMDYIIQDNKSGVERINNKETPDSNRLNELGYSSFTDTNINELNKPILKQMKFWLFLIGLIMILITSYAFYDFYKKNYKNSEIIKNNQFEQKDVPVTYTEFSKDLIEYVKKKRNKDWKLITPLLLLKKKGRKKFKNIAEKFQTSQITEIDGENQECTILQPGNFRMVSMKFTKIKDFLKDKKYKIKLIDGNFIFFIGEVLIDGSGKYKENPELKDQLPVIDKIIECFRKVYYEELEE